VELFFLRVLRGAGGEGVSGMKWRSPSPVNPKINLVRPLLGFSKAEILAFAREYKIRFREDATNAGLDFLRTRIRNELLPLLQKNYQPGLAKTVLRLMEIIGAETEFAGAAAESWLGSSGRESAQIKRQSRFTPRGTIIKENFAGLPIAVQRKVLQRQLMDFGIAFDFELVERLRRSPETWVSANSKFSVGRDAAGKVGLRRETTREFNLDQIKIKLHGASRQVEFGNRKFRWQIKRQEKFALPQNLTGREIFDADKIGGEIILRHWRAGDRFQPIGLKSAVKLQDLFVNAKIPMALRRDLIVAAAAGKVFWVQGLRIGEQFKLTAQTVRQLVWNWSNLADEFALQPVGE
jgi:tRNA(Ile)-lysidine synthase